ncbi:hypothetical protein PC129_g2833 [Phytophthora cactorum]|uniref:Uncharacterized protein n=1 Tax=Phytophthora cactorum TaxID=29920 RepID=A0A8T0ZKC3_9STRA|nr:hypothetical protein Pcac1_g5977 [Phytophthora cactorum]KAG3113546.1 hypothetical protein PI125_g7200 [Phytophthora idaei]KAG2835358.1 hypothetical protein PC112_g5733 [Phytophthora cactorum]KAG2839311.1 hypothetical protein PC111_g3884 [Phytophthora cactorum]KAG2863428.1 hypothetical protein PC113_g5419 [Phytophthora cactorum]
MRAGVDKKRDEKRDDTHILADYAPPLFILVAEALHW